MFAWSSNLQNVRMFQCYYTLFALLNLPIDCNQPSSASILFACLEDFLLPVQGKTMPKCLKREKCHFTRQMLYAIGRVLLAIACGHIPKAEQKI